MFNNQVSLLRIKLKYKMEVPKSLLRAKNLKKLCMTKPKKKRKISQKFKKQPNGKNLLIKLNQLLQS